MDQICRIYRPEKSKLAQTVQIELSTNSNTTRSQIRINAQASGHLRYMLHDSKYSTLTIYWLKKWLKKSFEQFTDQIKKAKRARELEINFS